MWDIPIYTWKSPGVSSRIIKLFLFSALNYVNRKATTAKPTIAPGLILEIGFTFYQRKT